MVNQLFVELNSLHLCCCAVKMLLTHAELVEWSLKLRPFLTFFQQNAKRDVLPFLGYCTRFPEHFSVGLRAWFGSYAKFTRRPTRLKTKLSSLIASGDVN